MVIRQLHKIDAKHVETMTVHETFEGKTVWQGEVEVFDTLGYDRARRTCAWSYKDDDGEHFVGILGLPPVQTPQDAVKVFIAAHAKKGK